MKYTQLAFLIIVCALIVGCCEMKFEKKQCSTNPPVAVIEVR